MLGGFVAGFVVAGFAALVFQRAAYRTGIKEGYRYGCAPDAPGQAHVRDILGEPASAPASDSAQAQGDELKEEAPEFVCQECRVACASNCYCWCHGPRGD